MSGDAAPRYDLNDRAAWLAGIKADVNEGIHRKIIAHVAAKISGIGKTILQERHHSDVHECAAGPAHNREVNDADESAGARQSLIREEAERSHTTASGQADNQEKDCCQTAHEHTRRSVRF